MLSCSQLKYLLFFAINLVQNKLLYYPVNVVTIFLDEGGSNCRITGGL